MPSKPKRFVPPHARTLARQREREYDKQRGTAHQRGPYCTKWWANKRREVATRDMYICQQCGGLVGMGKGDYHCDHIEDRPVGAAIDTERYDADCNLQTLCPACHRAKSGRKGRGMRSK